MFETLIAALRKVDEYDSGYANLTMTLIMELALKETVTWMALWHGCRYQNHISRRRRANDGKLLVL